MIEGSIWWGLDPQMAGTEQKPPEIKSSGNHVYFCSVVTADSFSFLMQVLRDKDKDIRSQSEIQGVEGEVPIWLHINSGGGSLYAGLGFIDEIRSIKTPIRAVMTGICASAATLLAMSCSKVYVAEYCKVLIHQFYAWREGKYLALVDDRKIEDDLFESLIHFYTKHSGLKRKEVIAILSHETWMNSKEAIEKGFAHKLYRG